MKKNNSNKHENLKLIFGTIVAFIFFMGLTKGHIGSSLAFALLALLILKIKDNQFKQKEHKEKRLEFEFLMDESDFSNHLIRLLGFLVHADQEKSQSEIRFIRKSLLEHYPHKKVDKIIQYVSRTSDRTKLPLKSICRRIRVEFNTASKVQLMYLLMGICTADGVLKKKEEEILKKIAIGIRLPFETFKALLSMFHFTKEGEQRKKRSRKRKKASSNLSLQRAYKILGLKPSATAREIKKAYRKLVMLHHPDRVSEEFKKSAEEKFQKVDEAYDLIKEKRAFK